MYNGFPVSDPLDENSHREVLCLYDVYDQIKDKLKEFRTLSLRRAPLKERLALLRQLAAADMGNASWNEMTADYEKSRRKCCCSDLASFFATIVLEGGDGIEFDLIGCDDAKAMALLGVIAQCAS